MKYILAFCLILSISFVGCTDDTTTEVGLPPEGTSFSPTHGSAGTQVLITGTGFPIDNSRLKVSINGAELPIVRSNEEQILVTIPEDSRLVGENPIVISILGADSFTTTQKFSFDAVAINSFAPNYGCAGSEVVINLSGLPSDVSSLKISIAGFDLPIVSSNGSEYTVVIPNEPTIGNSPFTITTAGQSYTTADEFVFCTFKTYVSVLAGTGAVGFADGPGDQAMFAFKQDWGEARRCGIAVDNDCNVYVGDPANGAFRKIAPDGTVLTLYQSWTEDWGMDFRYQNGGTGTYNGAHIRSCDLAIDSRGNLYTVADYVNCGAVIYPNGLLQYMWWGQWGGFWTDLTVAVDEQHNRIYYSNVNGAVVYKNLDDVFSLATEYSFNGAGWQVLWGVSYAGMVVDKATGDLYAVDHANNRIVKHAWNGTTLDSTPEVIAGSGVAGNADGAALAATFSNPWGIDMDAAGNLYIAGCGNAYGRIDPADLDRSIRVLDRASNRVWTLAGGSQAGNNNGGGNLTSVATGDAISGALEGAFGTPTFVAVDKNGVVYLLDRANNCVKKIVIQ
jgi:hypothetical protein